MVCPPDDSSPAPAAPPPPTAAEYHAMRTIFPHIRHDAAFFEHLLAYLRKLHKAHPHDSLIDLCYITRYRLQTNISPRNLSQGNKENEEHAEIEDETFTHLKKLISTHRVMEAEAIADYKKPGHSKWRNDPDCWRKRIAELRKEEFDANSPSLAFMSAKPPFPATVSRRDRGLAGPTTSSSPAHAHGR